MIRTIECEIVTPMFSCGGDRSNPNQKGSYPFELRPQSVKGVLRFWFRALAPLVIDIYNLNFQNLEKKEVEKWHGERYKGLKYLESYIFGSQDRKAPFGLRVEWEREKEKVIGRFEGSKFKSNFTKYSIYGLYDSRKRILYSYLPSGSKLYLHFFSNDQKILNIIQKLLEIVSIFSGFGAKVRKGYGEFRIVKPVVNRDIDPDKMGSVIGSTEKELRNFIESIPELKDKLILDQTKFESKVTEFPNFRAYKIIPLKNLKSGSWREVMEELYKVTKDNKGWYPDLKNRLRKSNGDVVRKLINLAKRENETNIKTIEIPPSILGLPLQYQNLTIETNIKKKNNKNLNFFLLFTFFSHLKENAGRKASPMHISIHKHNNNWYPLTLIFKSEITQKIDSEPILEKSCKVIIRGKDKKELDKENLKRAEAKKNIIEQRIKNFKALGYEDYDRLEELIKKLGGE